MRVLCFVPVIHTSSDLGSVAATVDESAAATLGDDVWRRHKDTVSIFWDSIALFFRDLQVAGLKVFQDGLVADGEVGLQIVNQGIKDGSRNYEIVGSLIRRGAILVRTEDIALVKQERTYVSKVILSKTPREMEAAALRYKAAQDRLLRQRDGFIAKRIGETLKDGDHGVLFLGAYHNVLPKLAIDISVIQIKDLVRVREYHDVLVRSRGGEFPQKIADRITAPVPAFRFNSFLENKAGQEEHGIN